MNFNNKNFNNSNLTISKLVMEDIINKKKSLTLDNYSPICEIKKTESNKSTSSNSSNCSNCSGLIINKQQSFINNIINNVIDIDEKDNEFIYSEININLNNNIKEKNEINKNNNFKEDFIIISNLNLLSKLEPKQKLFINSVDNNENILGFELMIDNSYVQNVSRWYYKQNRENTINHIKKLIEISINKINFYKLNDNLVEVYKYNLALDNSINGLKNLKITYQKDENIIKELEQIIENINKK